MNKINKEKFENGLKTILKRKEKELIEVTKRQDKMDDIPQEEYFDIPILEEEIEDIKYIIDNDYSDEAIEKIKHSTTSGSIYDLLCGIVTLTTYGNEEKELEFDVPEDFFIKEILRMGWKNREEFFNTYIFDNSFPIYENAKEQGLVIREKYVNAF